MSCFLHSAINGSSCDFHNRDLTQDAQSCSLDLVSQVRASSSFLTNLKQLALIAIMSFTIGISSNTAYAQGPAPSQNESSAPSISQNTITTQEIEQAITDGIVTRDYCQQTDQLNQILDGIAKDDVNSLLKFKKYIADCQDLIKAVQTQNASQAQDKK